MSYRTWISRRVVVIRTLAKFDYSLPRAIAFLLTLSVTACSGSAKSPEAGEEVPGTASTDQPPVIVQPDGPDGDSQSGGGSGPIAPSYVATLSTEKSTIRSGETIWVQLGLKSASGAPYDAPNLKITFESANGTSTGTFGEVAMISPGVHRAEFLGINAGTPLSVTAKINGSRVITALPTIMVIPGEIDANQTLVSTNFTSLPAGSSGVITIIPKDAAGNLIHFTTLPTLAFATSGGTSTGTFSTPTLQEDASIACAFIGQIAGTGANIRVTISDKVLEVSPGVLVVPGPASVATSLVSVTNDSIAAGSSTQVFMTLKDEFGNLLTAGGHDIAMALNSTSGNGILTSVTDLQNGTYEATFTGTLVGNGITINGSIANVALATAAPIVTVIPGPASTINSVTSLSASSVTSGETLTVTFTAIDAYGNPLVVGGQNITFGTATGTSTASFSQVTDHNNGTYTATLTGILAGTAARVTTQLNGTEITSPLPEFSVTPGPPSLSQSTVDRAAPSVVSGTSTQVSLTIRDAAGNIRDDNTLAITFSHNGGTSTGTLTPATYSGSGVYSASFTGVVAGSNTTLAAYINGNPVVSVLPTISVTPGPFNATTSTISVSPATIAAGSTTVLEFSARDTAGNLTPATGMSVNFILGGGTSSGSIGSIIDMNDGRYRAQLTGETAGSASEVTAEANGQNVSGVGQSITVTPGPVDLTNTIILASDSTIISGSIATITLVAFDAFNNQLTSTNAAVGFSFSGGESTGQFSAVTATGNGTYQAALTGIISGTPSEVNATYNSASVLSTVPEIEVQTGSISASGSTVEVSANTVQSSATATLTLTARDINGNRILSGGATVTFSYQGGESSGVIGPVTDVGDGLYTAVFTGLAAGTPTTIQATIGGTPVTSALPQIQVTSGPPFLIEVTGYPASTAGLTESFQVRAKDSNGNTVTSFLGTVTFTSSDSQATLPIDYTFGPDDNGMQTFSAVLRTAGSMTLTATDTSNAAITGTQSGIEITPAAANALYIGGSLSANARVCSNAIHIGVKDAFGNIGTAASAVEATLATNGTGAFYLESSCTTPITNTSIPIGESYTEIFYKSDDDGSQIFTATDVAGDLLTASETYVIKPWPAWFGSSASTSLFETNVDSARGKYNGQFNTPTAAVADQNGFIYVVDSSNNRIQKFDRTNDTYIGWIGKIGTKPTGGVSGCTTAAVNTATPGWCTGGNSSTSSPYTSPGFYYAPQSIYYHDGSLYVVDTSNHRIQRVDAETGAVTGWIGRIATTPTGGATGCSTTAVGTATPGWCIGGTAQSGTGDGAYNSPRYAVGDGTALYIADGSNHRIVKVNLVTGAVMGWYGRINTVPSGGATGCSTSAINATTPGWCLGGSAKSGTSNGHFNTPRGLALLDSTLFVADSGNHRIQRLNLTAAPVIGFSGWIGRVSASPTGGDAGCTGAAAGSFTPGWCTGGSANSSTGNGHMKTPYRVVATNSYLYVLDYGNHRIQRFNYPTPTFAGWSGRVLTSPTGGDPGCTEAAVNSTTPGWCSGGTSTWGYATGMRFNAQGLEMADNALLLSDSGNNRVEEIVSDTGIPSGVLGAKISAANWSISVTETHTGARDQYSMFTPTGLAIGSGSIYLADASNHRLKKYNLNTGALNGWLGAVSTPATGGGGSCTTAAAGQFSNGWCTGGDTKNGTGNGMLNSPQDVYAKNSILYVADGTNHRISRYDSETGAFTGWIGYISTAPNGGDVGCAGAAANSVTPGWCMGGTSKSGSVAGALNTPAQISADDTYLYVADRTNNRINRYALTTGAFSGWIGRIGTSPTGGDPGCSGAAAGTYTPGWCLGGTAATGTANGNFAAPRGIVVTNGSLYVVDSGNHRIQKFVANNGSYVGWIGRVNTAPTGGAVGCAGAAVNSFTPGWCTGGSAKSGTSNGHLNGPGGMWTNGVKLYIVDSSNNRIVRYTADTGAFNGWMGNINSAPTSGDSGCAGAAPGTLTPGWCIGGTARAGKFNGMLDSPQYISGSGVYVYVSDSNNARIMRFPQ